MKKVTVWKTGKKRRDRYIYMPEHPFSYLNGYIKESRVLMEKKIGRFLTRMEIVHHIDGNTLNNDINNLMVLNGGKHNSEHGRLRVKYDISYQDIKKLIKDENISHSELILKIMNKFNCDYFVAYRTINKFLETLENEGFKIKKYKVYFNNIRETIGNDIVNLHELCLRVMNKCNCSHTTAERVINENINKFEVWKGKKGNNKFLKLMVNK